MTYAVCPKDLLCRSIQVLDRAPDFYPDRIDQYSKESGLPVFYGFSGRTADLSTSGGFIRYKRKKRYIWRRWWYLTMVKVKVEEK